MFAAFYLSESYFEGGHVVQDPAFTQETTELRAAVRTVLESHLQVHDLDIAKIDVTGNVNQMVVQWRVTFTSPTDQDWSDFATFVESVAMTTALTNTLAGPLGTTHTNSFFETTSGLNTTSLGLQNAPSPPSR